jgi:hypothetical protein
MVIELNYFTPLQHIAYIAVYIIHKTDLWTIFRGNMHLTSHILPTILSTDVNISVIGCCIIRNKVRDIGRLFQNGEFRSVLHQKVLIFNIIFRHLSC